VPGQCPQDGKIRLQQLGVVGVIGGSTQPERPLTQRDGGVEGLVKVEASGIDPLKGRTIRRFGVGQMHEALRDVHPGGLDATPGKLVAVAPGSAADIQ